MVACKNCFFSPPPPAFPFLLYAPSGTLSWKQEESELTWYMQNFNETIKQWTGVFNYSETPQQTLTQTPSSAYTKYVYGDNVVGIFGQGVGHTVPIMGDQDMAWFGIA